MAVTHSKKPTPRPSSPVALTAKALRKGLLALQARQSLGPLQAALRPMARRLVGTRGSEDDVETLVSDFTTATVGEAGQRQLAALLALPDGQLPAAARRWLRQLNAERLPHWNLLRTLRRHVRKALGELHHADLNSSPTRLQTPGGDWNYPAVRDATARLSKANPALAKDANRLAEELFRQHGPHAELPLEAPEASLAPAAGMDPEERYHLFVEAERLMRELARDMGDDAFVVYALRMKGLGFVEIGSRMKRSTSWAHGRYVEATMALLALSDRHGLSARSALAVSRKAARRFTP
jgi:hypothetical protein